MASFAAQPFADILAAHGETMTLRRMAPGDPPSWADVTVKGKRRSTPGAVGDALVGTMTQKTLMIIISNREIAAAGWPGPPRKGDYLLIGSGEYVLQDDADTRTDGGTVLAHFLVAQGGGIRDPLSVELTAGGGLIEVSGGSASVNAA